MPAPAAPAGPRESLPTPRRRKPARRLPPEVLGPEEVLGMLGRCGERCSTGLRNRALITAMYRGGLRISEALDLLPKDVDLFQGLVRVLHGKGDRSRTVGLDPGACTVIGVWAERRKALGLGPRQPLLCTLKGERMEEAYIRVMLRRLAREAGIEKRVHPHGFRHTHAAELRQEGVDIGIISKQLGHRSIATTAKYLDHIAPYAVVEAVRARRWWAGRPAQPGGYSPSVIASS